MQLQQTVVIARDIGDVFDFLVAEPRFPLRRSVVRSAELSTNATRAGAVYRQILNGPGGRDIDSDYLIVALEPPRRLEFAIVAGPTRPTGTFHLVARDDRETQVTLTLDTSARGPRKLLAPFWNRFVRREVESLEVLKFELERAASTV